jgi:hypothetical protein
MLRLLSRLSRLDLRVICGHGVTNKFAALRFQDILWLSDWSLKGSWLLTLTKGQGIAFINVNLIGSLAFPRFAG